MYGNILGCHCLPGKAYIQYSNSSEADFAVSALNGYVWKGIVLEVKLVGLKSSSFEQHQTNARYQEVIKPGSIESESYNNRRSRSQSLDSVSDSSLSAFQETIKQGNLQNSSIESKAKIQINLLNRLSKRKEKSPLKPSDVSKLQQSSTSIAKPLEEKLLEKNVAMNIEHVGSQVTPFHQLVPHNIADQMPKAQPSAKNPTLRIDLTNPAFIGFSMPDLMKPPPNIDQNLYAKQVPGLMTSAFLTVLRAKSNLPTTLNSALNPLQVVMKAKMELYKKDLAKVNSKEELMKYLNEQGSYKIPETDPPLLFNAGILGADSLFQIVCHGDPDLESYYCQLCDYWSTVSEIFSHLTASVHRLNYMFRHYKVYHKKAMNDPNENGRDVLLQKFAENIWKIEGSGQCQNRMRCVMNAEDFERIWPDFRNLVDKSWKIPDLDEMAVKPLIKPSLTPKELPKTEAAMPIDSMYRPTKHQSEAGKNQLSKFLDKIRNTLSEQEPSMEEDSDATWDEKAAAFLASIGEKNTVEKIASRKRRDEVQSIQGEKEKPPGVDVPPSGFVYPCDFETHRAATFVSTSKSWKLSSPKIPPPSSKAPSIQKERSMNFEPTPASHVNPNVHTPKEKTDFQDILDVMGLSSVEMVRILQQTKPDMISQTSSSNQVQKPGPFTKAEEKNRPVRLYRRLVPPSPDKTVSKHNMAQDELKMCPKAQTTTIQPKTIPLELGKL